MTMQVHRGYPQMLACEGGEVEIRLLTPDDAAQVLAFAQQLSTHDLLFLRRDISQPKVVAAWMEATRHDGLLTVVATRGGELLGCATLVRDPLSWSRHVGELRVIVAASMRGKGIGQKLTHECFAIALEIGLEKLVAVMTLDQRGAIAVFEGLGFQPEALLRAQVKDREGKAHDIVMLSHDVAGFEAQRAAYGLSDAF
jgi:L-amino acid N-acyltransferase YncA